MKYNKISTIKISLLGISLKNEIQNYPFICINYVNYEEGAMFTRLITKSNKENLSKHSLEYTNKEGIKAKIDVDCSTSYIIDFELYHKVNKKYLELGTITVEELRRLDVIFEEANLSNNCKNLFFNDLVDANGQQICKVEDENKQIFNIDIKELWNATIILYN